MPVSKRAEISKRIGDANAYVVDGTDELIANYISGVPLYKLAKSAGVTRKVLYRIFTSRGVHMRLLAESQPLIASNMTAEDRIRRSAIAKSSAGRRAASKHSNLSEITQDEILFAKLVNEVFPDGTVVVPQLAVGDYNIDIAIPEHSIAVEVFGGGWHSCGDHAARHIERTKYILDQGWSVVIIWTARVQHPLEIGGARYLHALAEFLGRNQSTGRQYRVIWGDGKVPATSKSKLNSRAVMESLGCANESADWESMLAG